MADVKYKDSTPVDEPIPKGKAKAVEPGSDIRVDGKPNPVRANQLMNEADEKRKKARDVSQMYMGSDLSKAAANKQANMAEEDAEVLTERAKQYRKGIEGKKAGGMTASSRADGCCTKGKTRGKMY
jgi:uncharacterized protein YkwD